MTIGVVWRDDLPWIGKPSDPRAYSADSGDLSLAEGLRRAGLTVPGCFDDRLRYALVDNGFGYYYTVYLRIEASQDCVEQFVDANTLTGSLRPSRIGPADEDKTLPSSGPWQQDETVERLGWQVGPQQRFQKFGRWNDANYNVTALVQHLAPSSDDVVAYIHAAHEV
ncbi:hypothetical protein [Paractinoplanes ferrugineus]|uniref:hypothetical protein n=1 Tax=Paractinoplanes ferrugineus TaxID=113564 RepID=UPI0019455563|nr:hypothetical protein [Actinoplanes ferrugineus]